MQPSFRNEINECFFRCLASKLNVLQNPGIFWEAQQPIFSYTNLLRTETWSRSRLGTASTSAKKTAAVRSRANGRDRLLEIWLFCKRLPGLHGNQPAIQRPLLEIVS